VTDGRGGWDAQLPGTGWATAHGFRKMPGHRRHGSLGTTPAFPVSPVLSLVLATRCVWRACGTMNVVRPTVLIVDDHEAFRASARALLRAGGFDVICEAAGGMEAIEAVSAPGLEVVVLDIQLHDLDGLAVTERLAEAPDPPAVVLVSGREAATYGPRPGRTSARGFISKSEHRDRRRRTTPARTEPARRRAAAAPGRVLRHSAGACERRRRIGRPGPAPPGTGAGRRASRPR
jgi:CheY-like chemotaxis protein